MSKSRFVIRAAALIIAASFLVTCLSILVPRGVSANAGPFIVDGHVTDSAGRPIVGAAMTVVMKNGAATVDTQTTTTDSDGFYTVDVGHDLWQVGFTVTSIATYNAAQVQDSHTITIDDLFGVTIDLMFPFEIPQFGSMVGFVLAAAIVGIVAVVFLSRKGK